LHLDGHILEYSLAYFNPLNAKLNPTCYLLALLGAHPILHISRIRVNVLRKPGGETFLCLNVWNESFSYPKAIGPCLPCGKTTRAQVTHLSLSSSSSVSVVDYGLDSQSIVFSLPVMANDIYLLQNAHTVSRDPLILLLTGYGRLYS